MLIVARCCCFFGFASLARRLDTDTGFKQELRKTLEGRVSVITLQIFQPSSGLVITSDYTITALTGTFYSAARMNLALNHSAVRAVVTRRKEARLNNLQVNVMLWRECLIASNDLHCI